MPDLDAALPEYILIRKEVLHTLAHILMFNDVDEKERSLRLDTIPKLGALLHSIACENDDGAHEEIVEVAGVFESECLIQSASS